MCELIDEVAYLIWANATYLLDYYSAPPRDDPELPDFQPSYFQVLNTIYGVCFISNHPSVAQRDTGL